MEMNLATSPSKLAESLLWDAVDRGARVVHFQPSGAGHRLSYRTDRGLDEVVELGKGALETLDEQWRKSSTRVRSDDHRHLFLERQSEEKTERVQVRYQSLQTLLGRRLTLRLLREESTSLTIASGTCCGTPRCAPPSRGTWSSCRWRPTRPKRRPKNSPPPSIAPSTTICWPVAGRSWIPTSREDASPDMIGIVAATSEQVLSVDPVAAFFALRRTTSFDLRCTPLTSIEGY